MMSKISVLLLLGVVISLAAGDGSSDMNKLKKAHDDCQTNSKTKVSDDYMRNAAMGKKEASEANAKTHELCMSKHLGLMDADGKVVKHEVRETLAHVIKDEAKLEETVNKCAVQKDTPENTAFDLWVCLLKAGKRPEHPHDHSHHDHQHHTH